MVTRQAPGGCTQAHRPRPKKGSWTDRVPRHPVPMALAGAVAAALVWYALASLTGLIFRSSAPLA